MFETLEDRLLLSASSLARITATPTFDILAQVASPSDSVQPDSTISAPFTPTEVDSAYGVNQITFSGGTITGNGAGQTIAIIDAYNDPDILSDVANFNNQTQWSLPQFNVAGGPTLKIENQTGGSSLPADASKGGWDIEESLDVEWAHAIAPEANIVLFEANSNNFSDLLTAVSTASSTAGVSVVSMSWSGGEFSGENSLDSYFAASGVTYVASTGDSGEPAGYPAYSPNVIAVGGTSLTINSDYSWGGETGWSGSGGGLSADESQPGFQKGNVNGVGTSGRAAPDVSAVADPNTGVYVYDSYAGGWYEVGGTSLAAPVWAGLIAITNQGRVANGYQTLNHSNINALQAIYNLPSGDFHDIVSGSNGYSAGPGYDLVTGRGSPIANLLVPDLASVATNSTTKLAFGVQPPNGTAGVALSPSVVVDLENSSGAVVTTNNSFVTLSLASGSGTLSGTLTVEAVNGVATFNNLSLSAAGNYKFAATDGSLTSATSNSFTISAIASQAMVAGEYIFYNDSTYDGNNLAANSSDFSAIATDKSALLPGQTATFANYTSYSQGINGIIIDFTSLSSGATLTASDFQFAVGNSNTPSSWSTAPVPTSITVTTDPRNGDTAADLIWANNAIQDQWLQVTVLADSNTRLTSDYTFYFGNAIGETGNSTTNAQVDASDELLARDNFTGLGTASITNDYDFNRDGYVNVTDELIARDNFSGLSPLQLITAPATTASPSGVSGELMANSKSVFLTAQSVEQFPADDGNESTEDLLGSGSSNPILSLPSLAIQLSDSAKYGHGLDTISSVILRGKLRGI